MIRLVPILLVLAACGAKDDDPPEWTAPPVMEPAEQQRGLQACTAYVERLCACAETHADLADQCTLARSQPEALDQLLGMVNGDEGKLGDREIREAQHSARRIIKDCFEKDAALSPTRCPR